MTAQSSQTDRYSVTELLFDFIDDLSADKQFELYAQLIQDRVGTELFKLIIDLSDEEKKLLLEQLRKTSIKSQKKTTGELG